MARHRQNATRAKAGSQITSLRRKTIAKRTFLLKEIFIGGSKEGLEQAMQVAAILSEVDGVQPLLWTDCFKLGDITFMGIEDVARRVAGAAFLATPDDACKAS